MTNRQQISVVLALWLGLTGAATQASAHGALAIGLPSDIGKDGFAIGYSNNQPSPDAAQNAAMQQCLTSDTSPEVLALCKLVVPYSHRCLSIAFDPDVNTYGFGWALGDTQAAADDDAMAHCRSTSTSDRAGFCATKAQKCDIAP